MVLEGLVELANIGMVQYFHDLNLLQQRGREPEAKHWPWLVLITRVWLKKCFTQCTRTTSVLLKGFRTSKESGHNCRKHVKSPQLENSYILFAFTRNEDPYSSRPLCWLFWWHAWLLWPQETRHGSSKSCQHNQKLGTIHKVISLQSSVLLPSASASASSLISSFANRAIRALPNLFLVDVIKLLDLALTKLSLASETIWDILSESLHVDQAEMCLLCQVEKMRAKTSVQVRLIVNDETCRCKTCGRSAFLPVSCRSIPPLILKQVKPLANVTVIAEKTVQLFVSRNPEYNADKINAHLLYFSFHHRFHPAKVQEETPRP